MKTKVKNWNILLISFFLYNTNIINFISRI